MPNRRLVRKDQLKMASRSLVLMFVLMVSLVIVSQGVLTARELAEKTKGNIYHPCADALSISSYQMLGSTQFIWPVFSFSISGHN